MYLVAFILVCMMIYRIQCQTYAAIVGGSYAARDEFPYMAFVLTDGHKCGGVYVKEGRLEVLFEIKF